MSARPRSCSAVQRMDLDRRGGNDVKNAEPLVQHAGDHSRRHRRHSHRDDCRQRLAHSLAQAWNADSRSRGTRLSGALRVVGRGMFGHWIMDIGLFAYWWTQIAGIFTQRPISEAGMDGAFYIECAVFVISVTLMLVATARLRELRLARTACDGGVRSSVF